MEQFRAFHYIIEASFLFLCIANVKTVYNKHLATLRTEQATFSKKNMQMKWTFSHTKKMLTQTQRSRSGQRALQCGRCRVSATGGRPLTEIPNASQKGEQDCFFSFKRSFICSFRKKLICKLSWYANEGQGNGMKILTENEENFNKI